MPHEREDERLRFHGLRAQVKHEQHTDALLTRAVMTSPLTAQVATYISSILLQFSNRRL